jgi:hypothetical protein
MLATVIINSVLIAAAVMIHYELLRWLSVVIPKLAIRYRLRVVFAVFGALCAHVIEIWLFAAAYFFMTYAGGFGSLHGNFDNSVLDCVYFSFTSYTSLGFGDIVPSGNIRFLAGLEALVGLLLIAWTASFIFIEMTKFWKEHK